MKKLPFLIAAVALMFFMNTVSASFVTSYIGHIDIPENGSADIKINADVALSRIVFMTTDTGKRIKLHVFRNMNVSGNVYDYFMVNATRITSAENVAFDIDISKDWIFGSGMNSSRMSFMHYDGRWKDVPGRKLSEDNDYLRLRFYPESLTGFFSIIGSSDDVDIGVSSPCKRDGFCDSEMGEDRDNCPDCVPRSEAICVPSKRECMDGYVFVCSRDGSSYEFEVCENGCENGECLPPSEGITGMFVGANPAFLGAFVVMVIVIGYLALTISRLRSEMKRAERIKFRGEDIKMLARKEE